MSSPKLIRRPHRGLLLFAAFCLALPVSFILLHLVTPSDGARLARDLSLLSPQGLVLEPYLPGQGPLRAGDILLAIDGVSVESWVANLADLSVQRPELHLGDRLTYAVLREGKQLELQVILDRLPWRAILAEHWGVILSYLLLQAIALFVYLQRPKDPAAIALFVWALSSSHTYTWSFSLQVSDYVAGVGFWLFRLAASGLWLVSWSAAVYMILVFPKPLFPPDRNKLYFALAILFNFALFALYLAFRWTSAVNTLDWWNAWHRWELLSATLVLPLLIALFVYQYVSSRSPAEKIKIRWVILGGLTTVGLVFALYFLAALIYGRPLLSPNALGLSAFPFAITLAIAIWRYQLFDIDVILQRTLVYGALTATLVLIYFSSVILLQQLVNRIAGGGDSSLVVVVSTLLIAALFNPLRRRIQSDIDRRFYRRKYNAEQTLERFSAGLRDEVDLDELRDKLMAVVAETMQPERISLWLNPAASKTTNQEIKR